MNEVKGAYAVEVAFFARFAKGAPEVRLNPEDHSEGRWFSEDEVAEYAENRDKDDPSSMAELCTIARFALLRGEKLHT
jgi:hypothetical protein